MTEPAQEKNKSQAGQVIFDLPPDLELIYANMARISHTPADFVLDFARLLAGMSQAEVAGRVVMSPVAIKMLLRAMAENIARYEAAFGEIKVPGDGALAMSLFRRRSEDKPEDPPSE